MYFYHFTTIQKTTKKKKDFTEGCKILLDTNQKIILLDHRNNFIGILKIMSNAANNFDILAINFSVLYNYFDVQNKITFLICVQLKF